MVGWWGGWVVQGLTEEPVARGVAEGGEEAAPRDLEACADEVEGGAEDGGEGAGAAPRDEGGD